MKDQRWEDFSKSEGHRRVSVWFKTIRFEKVYEQREMKLALKERFEIGKTFLRTFRSSPTIQTIEEIYLYTGSDLLADIGGYLGLLLGVSAFTLYTAVEDLLRAFKCKWNYCSQKDEEKEPE